MMGMEGEGILPTSPSRLALGPTFRHWDPLCRRVHRGEATLRGNECVGEPGQVYASIRTCFRVSRNAAIRSGWWECLAMASVLSISISARCITACMNSK